MFGIFSAAEKRNKIDSERYAVNVIFPDFDLDLDLDLNVDGGRVFL